MASYNDCIHQATKRTDLKLCPRGYCSAKQKFEIYPSAYANAYAVSVCKGDKQDYTGERRADKKYTSLNTKGSPSGLRRWLDEKWVNVCERGTGEGGYKPCGSGEGLHHPKKYPYCRPYYKLPGTTVKTVGELSATQLENMCKKKRADPVKRVSDQIGAGFDTFVVPSKVRDAAKMALKIKEMGFDGGTDTGINRARQLAHDKTISVDDLADMRTWFARHVQMLQMEEHLMKGTLNGSITVRKQGTFLKEV